MRVVAGLQQWQLLWLAPATGCMSCCASATNPQQRQQQQQQTNTPCSYDQQQHLQHSAGAGQHCCRS
jgi:hypothetical protein